MTDTEIKRREAICEAAHVDEIDDVSDGFHTFRQLYYQRMMLFAAIVKQNKDKAWKSLRHEDGELCFGGGWFIVGVDTPEGSFTYHYEDNYFSLFDCEELERGKYWDGHTEKDVTRLLSLSLPQPEPYEDALKKIKNASFVGSDGLDYVETRQALDALKDAIGVTLHVAKISKHCSDFSDLDEVIECEDAVSREAVSSWLKQYGQDVLHGKYKFSLMYIWKNLMDLPSVTPKRKTGKWILLEECANAGYYCSECRKRVVKEGWSGTVKKIKFCPNCGADMRKESR